MKKEPKEIELIQEAYEPIEEIDGCKFYQIREEIYTIDEEKNTLGAGHWPLKEGDGHSC